MAVPAESGRLADPEKLLQELRINREHQAEARVPRSRRWIIGAIVLVVVSATGLSAYFVLHHSAGFQVETAAAIAHAEAGGSTATLQASGYVTARRQATVSTQITGMLTEVLIEEGEHVTAGQVLAHLDDAAAKAALSQAQAQAKAAQALRVQFDAQLAQARRDLKRHHDLLARQLVSAQALEAAGTQVETLQAQVESQRRQVELAQAAVRGGEVQLNYTTVRAPFSGVIVAKTAQAGEIVSPMSAGGGFTRTGVGTIVDMDSLEIEVDVNEAYINRVKPSQPAEATLDAYPDARIPAHVIAIVPTADRSKATVKVRVAIEQRDPRILPDMGVKVSFLDQKSISNAESESAPYGVLVPSSAIVERNGTSVLFRVDGHRVRAQPVTPGQVFGNLRLVDGLASGMIVVRTPPGDMTDGARILVRQ